MRLRITIPDDDAAFLEAYAVRAGLTSRSAVVRQAIALLREDQLIRDYVTAFDEWADSGETAVWETTTRDGRSR